MDTSHIDSITLDDPALPPPLPEGEADDLLRRMAAGDVAAREALLARNLPGMRAYAHGRLRGAVRTKEQTGDVLSQAAIRMLSYRGSARFANEAAFQAFLRRVVDSVVMSCLRYYKQPRRCLDRDLPMSEGTTVVEEVLAPGGSPRTQVSLREEKSLVRRAMQELDPLDHEIVSLHDLDQVSHEEIGKRLGLTGDCVRQRYKRALKRLKGLYERFRREAGRRATGQ